MTKKQLLISILIVSAILRIGWLWRGDTVNDEVFMAFRGIGMIDFDEANVQTTPLEWYDQNTPWWTNFSFHDHPLLVPLTEYASMKIFGENNFGFRLPSALLGIASVYLIYLIGAQLYSQNIGLIAAALLGTTLNNVYISRTGMQEPYVIFFLLLGSYLFLKSLREPRYLFWTSVVIGLGAEAKYNSLILIPIFLTYLFIWRRDLLKNKGLWYGMIAFLILFSPTIIYNLKLYQATGHFDLQFSYILGQVPEDVWKIAPGKDIGSIGQRIRDFIPRLIATNSWTFLLLTAASFGALIFSLFKNPKETFQKNRYLLLTIFYLLFLLLKIGPAYRFLTMLTPFFALSVAIFLDYLYLNILNKKIAYILLGLLLTFETAYAFNNQIAYYPIGPDPWLSSKVRYENYNWGYNELGEYLDKELAGKMPALTFDLQYKFLEKLRGQALEDGQRLGLDLYPALVVYDGNFDQAGKLWILDRLHIYHAWPIISINTYFKYLQEKGSGYYDKIGFKNYYFIFQNNLVPSDRDRMLMRGTQISIYNKRGDEAFKVYKF